MRCPFFFSGSSQDTTSSFFIARLGPDADVDDVDVDDEAEDVVDEESEDIDNNDEDDDFDAKEASGNFETISITNFLRYSL